MNHYRADVVGSMLRPDYLLKARQEYADGKLTDAQFKLIEDRSVDESETILVLKPRLLSLPASELVVKQFYVGSESRLPTVY